MNRQLCRAILPALTLAQAIGNWTDISSGLSERPRRRRLQGEHIYEVLERFC